MNKKICGVAVNDLKYSEQYGDRKIYKKALDRWHSMINRCYNVKDKCYKTYGAKGVYVCNDWLYFSNYLYWFMDNYIEGYHVDKDILKEGYYSPDTCLFISPKENIAEMHNRVQMNFKNSSNYKPFEYYETTPIQSSNFKQKCIREGVDYYDFEPKKVENGRFIYIYSPENSSYRESLDDPYLRFSIIPSYRSQFKKFCKNNSLNFYDFIETVVGKKGSHELYNYFYKKEEN